MKNIKISTWNVNSIRARLDNFTAWVKQSSPDIILLQEAKCLPIDFPEEYLLDLGYNSLYVGQKSYNGVAILSKYRINQELTSLIEEDTQARYVEGLVTIDNTVIRLASVYVPRGEETKDTDQKIEDTSAFKYKLKFFDALHERMVKIAKFDEYVLFGGDFNVAHKDIDIHNPKAFKNKVGFHPMEKEKLNKIHDLGYEDMFRKFKPEMIEYTWWDYRRGGFIGNRGWRIDYMFANQKLVSKITDCSIHRELRGTERPSDHVPVEVLIEI